MDKPRDPSPSDFLATAEAPPASAGVDSPTGDRGTDSLELFVTVHDEEGSLWATVHQYPGCFAAGDNVEELFTSLGEAIALWSPAMGQRPVSRKPA